MTYWTLLVITIISGPLKGTESFHYYTSQAECEAATSAVSNTISYDHSIDCEVTPTPSSIPRPVLRTGVPT